MTTDNAGYADPLSRLSAYRLGIEAMRNARADAMRIGESDVLRDVAGQLLRAAASIPANIAEGYSRGTAADRRRFLEYALGSARECVVWYETAAHPEQAERIARLTSIRRLLLTMIKTSRESTRLEKARFRS